MNPIFGETTESREYTHYIVQAKWPKSEFGKPKNRLAFDDPSVRWGGYSPRAYNDKDNPNTKRSGFGSVVGNFDEVHTDVSQHPSRVTDRYGRYDEMPPTFSDPLAALAYANRLSEFGEIASRYSDGGTQESRDLQYDRRFPARVVQKRLATIERVLEGMK